MYKQLKATKTMKTQAAAQATWVSIERHIKESHILTMLAEENTIHDIDYDRYLKYGYSQADVSIGFELIQLYKLLNK